MWQGVEDLSDHSLGIELEGFHDAPFTHAQYRSLASLLGVLRKRFGVQSRDVLEHYRVAYAPPNRFSSRNRRGRKRDPGRGNFDRRRAGLVHEYVDDPDAVAGRVDAAPARGRHRVRHVLAGVLRRGRSAWSLAGRRYRDPTTLYRMPDGTQRLGDQIRNWSRLPEGTRVYLPGPG